MTARDRVRQSDYDWLPLQHFAQAVEEIFAREPRFR
jgi:hypothetical protein